MPKADEPPVAVELKACPFCGGEAQIEPKNWCGRDYVGVFCVECNLFMDCRAPDEPAAIAAWNTRPVQPQPVGREAIVCRHEPYQGACAHCGIQFRDGRPVAALSGPAGGDAGASEDVQRFAIRVEKLLCAKLGIPWTASGISIESLIERLSTPTDLPRVASEAMVEDWWKPAPGDPFWLLENESGAWLANEHSQTTTRDAVKAIRYPSEWHADLARRGLVAMGHAHFKPTEHAWIDAALSGPAGAGEEMPAEIRRVVDRALAKGSTPISSPDRFAEGLEAAAKVADALLEEGDEAAMVGYVRGSHFTAKYIAAAIRNLTKDEG